jgi:hypothetical protein
MDGRHTIPITTPDKSAAPQPSDNARFWAQFLTQMRAYFVSNVAASVITVWSVFLFVGGVFFLVYFASIGFMPEIDVKTSVALLAVSAFTGGFLLIGLGFYLLAPSWWWVHMTPDLEPVKSARWFALPVGGVLLSFTLSAFLIEPLIPKWWWVIPLLFIVMAPLPLLLPIRKVLEKFGKVLEKFGKVLEKLFRKPQGWQRLRLEKLLLFCRKLLEKFKPRLKLVAGFYWGFLPSIFLFVPLFLVISGLISENPDARKNAMLNFLLVMSFIWLCNLVIVKSFTIVKSFSILGYLTIAAATLFFIISSLNAWTFFPRRVMTIYKFGNLPNASLVLDETGCAIAQHHWLITTPYIPNTTTHSTSNPKTCSLSGVMIRSRLGNTYYLETPHSNGTSVVQFTIPGQNVLSWAINEPKE